MDKSEPDTKKALQERIVQLEAAIAGLEGTSKMLVGRDIALRHAYEDLKSVDAQKSEFISIAGHQLRTPLTTARWAHTKLLEESAGMTEQQRELLERSAASIGHMHQLVEDILELNHIEYGSFSITKTAQSVESILEAVTTELQAHSAAKDISLNTTWAKESKDVSLDEVRMREVFANVIENAIKYTPTGGKVQVSTAYTDSTCEVTVADTGPGIPLEKQTVIFQKFTRLPEAKKVDPNGTGLGLYIAKRIVELHNGSIRIEPETQSGTTFVIIIPI